MILFMLRHGIAVERGDPDYPEDRLRPLTPEGKKKMQRIAKGMKAMDLSIDLVLSSPYIRAAQTAEIAARELRLEKKLHFSETLEAEGNPESVIHEINENYGKAKSILLVGHEPYLSHLISTLLSGNSDIPIELKKGGLCKLEIHKLRYGACATLSSLLTPKQLAGLR